MAVNFYCSGSNYRQIVNIGFSMAAISVIIIYLYIEIGFQNSVLVWFFLFYSIFCKCLNWLILLLFSCRYIHAHHTVCIFYVSVFIFDYPYIYLYAFVKIMSYHYVRCVVKKNMCRFFTMKMKTP